MQRWRHQNFGCWMAELTWSASCRAWSARSTGWCLPGWNPRCSDAVHVRRSYRDRRGREQLTARVTRASPLSSTTSASVSSGRTTDTARRCSTCSTTVGRRAARVDPHRQQAMEQNRSPMLRSTHPSTDTHHLAHENNTRA